jgi:hypothetical protein
MMENFVIGFVCGLFGGLSTLGLTILFKFKIGGLLYWLIDILITLFLLFISVIRTMV